MALVLSDRDVEMRASSSELASLPPSQYQQVPEIGFGWALRLFDCPKHVPLMDL